MTAGLTSTQLTELVLAVFLAVVGVGLGLYARSRLQRRKAQLIDELQRRPDLLQDRAFNRLAMVRREVDLLARQGVEVRRAREQIAGAQASFDNHRYEQAYQTAQVVHESLVHVRRNGAPLPTATPRAVPVASSAVAPVPTGDARSSIAATDTPIPPIVKNRAESQFQLRLLDQELTAARPGPPGTSATSGAAELARRAHSAFDRADFTEAFRLALKGRRSLGGAVESLPPTPGSPPSLSGPIPSGSGGNGGDRNDPDETAPRSTEGDRCPECGYPALASDAFCRGCGRSRPPSVCPQCGTPKTSTDTFCGRCGSRFA